MLHISHTHHSKLSHGVNMWETSYCIQKQKSFMISHPWIFRFNPCLGCCSAAVNIGKGIRDQITNLHWIVEKAREFQKNIYFCFIDYVKAFDCVDHNKLWKILKNMGIPDNLTCLLRNLNAGEEAIVRTRQQIGSKLGKEYVKAVYCHPTHLTYMQSTSC